MKLFKKNRNEINIPDKAANSIANGILKFQGWFAASLQRLTKSWKQGNSGFFFV